MRNVVFVVVNKNVYEVSKVLFQRNKFFLKYSNSFCGYFIPKENPKINIWVTTGIYNKHNLMVFDKVDKGVIVISKESFSENDFWNNLKKNYDQLRKISKKISIILVDIEKKNFKQNILQWCIEHNNMECKELTNKGISLDNL